MKTLSFRFSLFYFFSIGIFSFILAFFPVHCRNIGLSPLEIAIVTAFGTLATTIGAPLALQASHSWRSPRTIFTVCLSLAFIFYLPLFNATTFYATATIWLFFNIAKRGTDSIIDARSIRISQNNSSKFENMRMWGSVGFVLINTFFGFLIDFHGQDIIITLGATNVAFLVLTGFLLRKDLPAATSPEEAFKKNETSTSSNPYVLLFCAVALCLGLITASHSILYIYFSLYLEALGWSASSISFAWSLGVIAEILMFMNFKFLEENLGLYKTLALSCFLTCIRWIVLSTTKDSSLLLLNQLLHGFSFGGCYICSVKLVPKILPDKLADRGQGYMIAIGFGLGSFLGRGLSGYLARDLTQYGNASSLFHSSVILSVIALIIACILLKKKRI